MIREDMTREELIQVLYNWCDTRIDYFFHKQMIAQETIEENKCPLRMAYPQLYNEMQNAIGEWFADNDADSQEWDIDAENVYLGY